MILLTLVAPAYYVVPGFIVIGFLLPYCVMLYFEKTKREDGDDLSSH